jgi:malate synthase
VARYVAEPVKAPWYIDLLNLNLNNENLEEAKRRINLYFEEFGKNGTRITKNLDFATAS